MEDFLNSQQLVKILKDALLNMHPAIYEAYGMTIVEAGACGVPTLLNWKGIGAEQLLSAPKGASISIEMEDRAKVVTKVMALLQDPEYLASVGKEAYKAATSWNEESHVAALWDLVETRMTMIETQDDPQ
jgi:glycosyltransferase involved in cell wall biosynthesis